METVNKEEGRKIGRVLINERKRKVKNEGSREGNAVRIETLVEDSNQHQHEHLHFSPCPPRYIPPTFPSPFFPVMTVKAIKFLIMKFSTRLSA